MLCRVCNQPTIEPYTFCDGCWKQSPSSSKGPMLHTITLYCGQCGEKHLKGTPWDFSHNCTQGREVTGVRFCIFCGDAYVEPHTCNSHDLRDFWKRPHASEAQIRRRLKVHNVGQLALIEEVR